MQLLKGGTLHMLDTGSEFDPERGHLHIILSNECSEGKHLLVPISSVRDKCDRTCVLSSGDHPFIKHDSYVFYARAKICLATDIKKGILSKKITIKNPLDNRLLDFVCKGLMESRHSSLQIKNYYEKMHPKIV